MKKDTLKDGHLKAVQDSGNEYVRSSDIEAYLKNRLGEGMGVPASRTLRYLVGEGVIERPRKVGREAFYNADAVAKSLVIVMELKSFNPRTEELRNIMQNARNHNDVEGLVKVVKGIREKVKNQAVSNSQSKALLSLLSQKKPSDLSWVDILENKGYE